MPNNRDQETSIEAELEEVKPEDKKGDRLRELADIVAVYERLDKGLDACLERLERGRARRARERKAG